MICKSQGYFINLCSQAIFCRFYEDMNRQLKLYNVGGHYVALDMPAGYLSDEELSSYAPFKIEGSVHSTPIFTLTLGAKDDVKMVSTGNVYVLDDDSGCMAISQTGRDELSISISTAAGSECCRMSVMCGYRRATAWIGGEKGIRRYAMDSVMMLLYTFASSSHATLLVHASVVEYEGNGYLFLGRSGTGKSTHSRLWIENVAGAKLLNDDNPVVRVTDSGVYVCGSPWSGKTPCYIDRCVPLASIVRLHQAPRNSISRLAGAKAYAAFLPSCSCMKWDHEMAREVHDTVSEVIANVPVFDLECLADRGAALLCHDAAVGEVKG